MGDISISLTENTFTQQVSSVFVSHSASATSNWANFSTMAISPEHRTFTITAFGDIISRVKYIYLIYITEQLRALVKVPTVAAFGDRGF